jgi:hypothetical protein
LTARRSPGPSLGFDEIAIKRLRFLAPLGELEGGLIARALLFIAEKRSGMSDADAFKAVMEMTLGQVEERFEEAEARPGKSPEDDWDGRWANFVIGTGLAFTPEQFMALTVGAARRCHSRGEQSESGGDLTWLGLLRSVSWPMWARPSRA